MTRTAIVISLAAVLLVGALSGCAPSRKRSVPMPVLTVPPEPEVDQTVNPGSMFQPEGASYLFADTRARRVGDIVVVNIVESTTAKNKATTKSNKDSSIDLGVGAFMGRQDFLGAPIGAESMIKAGSSGKLNSDGETKRENYITSSVAARIVRVVNNDLYEIEGARETRVNDETQIIVARGLIRARDIAPDNTIPSNKIANAKIELFGEGVLADRQKPGWLTRILDNVWPF